MESLSFWAISRTLWMVNGCFFQARGGNIISIHGRSNRVLLEMVKMLQMKWDVIVSVLLFFLTNCVLGIIVPDFIVQVALRVVIVIILRILVSCLSLHCLGELRKKVVYKALNSPPLYCSSSLLPENNKCHSPGWCPPSPPPCKWSSTWLDSGNYGGSCGPIR